MKRLIDKPDATPSRKAYALAGVDVDLGNRVKSRIHERVKVTHGPEVLGKVGGFGGLFQPNFRGMKEPVLVSSVDGVGTKLKIAFAANRHDTVGQDLVNHCINDIAVVGAKPLFFLDYIGAERLEPPVFEQLIKGFTKACKAGGCALIGGETAQMPGMYQPGEYDLAGTIVGVVDRRRMIDGSRIKPGDVVIGLASNGLHTNGYSLAREVLFNSLKCKLDGRLPGLVKPLGEELLRVHRNYQPMLAQLPTGLVKGLAHITGGGLLDNLPRTLPADMDAVIDTKSWKVPALFEHIQRGGKIRSEEMYQVFNMGIGMVVIVAAKDQAQTLKLTKGHTIGRVEAGSQVVRLEF
ncbi:MAG TPA: phosphoribosylformylglycinamidine cyclo-ligase [Chthoniobacteraceae bacterium]|jgi:phosphoribosylformylglycinamidine cyclo-ligase|nr:purM [Chthoniobacter sp.]HEV7868048.1 phosphoribosylformylglycinamidine cyclo-ligase [Chthoniobacteraceae bacterium]